MAQHYTRRDTITFKRFRPFFCAIVLTGLFSAAGISVFAAKPNTIPSLREWTDGTGNFTFTSASRIVLDVAAGGILDTTGAVFADDILWLFGSPITVVTLASPATGDIFLSRSSTDTALHKEGYSMSITDRIIITARTDTGVFYGTRTVLQLIKQNSANTIAAGTARDWPTYRERGILMDIGRKYFTMNWVKEKFKDLAYFKMNVAYLHLSDNQGFHLACVTHPEITQTPTYSHADMDSLQALAGRYKIMIIPEIGFPGHTGAMLRNHPELIAAGNLYDINLAIDTAYRWISSILNEYIPWFGGPYWHGGCDEYCCFTNAGMQAYARAHYSPTASAKDCYLGFINVQDSIAKSKGKVLRIWSDGAYGGTAVKVNADIVYEIWTTTGPTAQAAIDSGHYVENSSTGYYVLGGSRINNQNIYENWDPHQFPNSTISVGNPKNLGAKPCIWADNPTYETEDSVTLNINPSIRVYAQKNWGTTKLTTTYALFTPIIATIGSAPWVGQGPGLSDLARHKPVIVSSTETANTPAQCAVDGDRDHYYRWASASSDPQWIYVDLQGSYSVNLVVLRWENAYGRSYQIQVSPDAATWTSVYTTTTGNGNIDSIPLTPVVARYVRMYGTARGTTNGYSLWEFEVYGNSTAVNSQKGVPAALRHLVVRSIKRVQSAIVFEIRPIGDNTTIDLEIYSLLGRRLYSACSTGSGNGVEGRTIVIDGLSPGVYYYAVTQRNATTQGRFLVR